MTHGTRLPLSALTTLLLLCAPAVVPAAAHAARPPNVVLIITDDQGYGDLGCHGNPMVRTPHLDRLHGQSVRLTNFHVDPTCAPTRAALMTGRYSARTGVWHTIMGRSLLHHDEATMADVFRAAGYRTGIVGKWHLGDNYPMRPEDRGFDEALVHGGGGVGQTPDYWGNDYDDDTYFRDGKPERTRGYCTSVFFDEALAFVERNRERPFFLYLATNVPHEPYVVADAHSKPYREQGVPDPMAAFYGMITDLDANVGRLTDKLKAAGLENDTILVFTTDNGTAAGAPQAAAAKAGKAAAGAGKAAGWRGFDAGMRGFKGSEYDGGHRVPCFVRWPGGGIGGGRDVPQLTAHVDLLPTLVELCGVAKPRAALDGTSLTPLLKGGAAAWPDRTLVVHSQRVEHPQKWRKSAVMTDRWRLVNGAELYDMSADPGQRANVAAAHPETVRALRAAYDRWWDDVSGRFDGYAHIVIGSDQENPSRITCHDWHAASDNEVPWHQRHIVAAPLANGYWMVDVARPGRYRFTLRQRPAEANFPIEARRARLRIGDVEAAEDVPPGAAGVTLTVDLPAGPRKLQTWFDLDGGKSRGAFFVDAARVNEPGRE